MKDEFVSLMMVLVYLLAAGMALTIVLGMFERLL